jgi:hypothetical protein
MAGADFGYDALSFIADLSSFELATVFLISDNSVVCELFKQFHKFIRGEYQVGLYPPNKARCSTRQKHCTSINPIHVA